MKILVSSSRVRIIDHDDMQDGMDKDWNDEVVSAAILAEVEQSFLDVDMYVTFDSWGISGHKNHIGTHKGLIAAMLSLNRTITHSSLSVEEKLQQSRLEATILVCVRSITPFALLGRLTSSFRYSSRKIYHGAKGEVMVPARITPPQQCEPC